MDKNEKKNTDELFENQKLVLHICYLHYGNFVLLIDTQSVVSGVNNKI